MSTLEFSRIIDIRSVDDRELKLSASAEECAALALRFALVKVEKLSATLTLIREGAAVAAEGRLVASIVQSCAISGEDLPVTIDEPLAFRFVPEAAHRPNEELEITEEECDEIPFDGAHFDLGEAVAQSLALAIDPFAEGPEAEMVRDSGVLGEEKENPFAALAALKGGKKE